jgi:hypothetical protein
LVTKRERQASRRSGKLATPPVRHRHLDLHLPRADGGIRDLPGAVGGVWQIKLHHNVRLALIPVEKPDRLAKLMDPNEFVAVAWLPL